MTNFKQTWWDLNLENKMETFKSWIGDYNSESKKFIRQYVINNNYASLADFGCGVATEYFGYKNDNYNIKYLGIDSSSILNDKNTKVAVPMLFSDINETQLKDNEYEVSFSRHVLEHQPTYKDSLNEMIRVASKEVINIFFIKPDKEKIDYNLNLNLYHNTYDKLEIESFCMNNKKVHSIEWLEINDKECSLHVKIKPQ
jgi:ubiquinone/menaquinone biosynthesis C-methylase UbiE